MSWLILEDNPARVAAFESAARRWQPPVEVRVWRIAAEMIESLALALPGATLLSLDHDLYRQQANDPEPGCGRDVANYLARQAPHCPVIIHSTNTDAAWGMHGALTGAGWEVEIIHHLEEPGWIETRWSELARRLTRERSAAVARPDGSATPRARLMPGSVAHMPLAEALAMGPPPPGNLATPVLAHGTLTVELYAPVGSDRQQPHTRDEIYFVARGEGRFFDGEQRYPVEAGAFLFVPAGAVHRFEDFSADFAVWVAFYGPEGGERDA